MLLVTVLHTFLPFLCDGAFVDSMIQSQQVVGGAVLVWCLFAIAAAVDEPFASQRLHHMSVDTDAVRNSVLSLLSSGAAAVGGIGQPGVTTA